MRTLSPSTPTGFGRSNVTSFKHSGDAGWPRLNRSRHLPSLCRTRLGTVAARGARSPRNHNQIPDERHGRHEGQQAILAPCALPLTAEPHLSRRDRSGAGETERYNVQALATHRDNRLNGLISRGRWSCRACGSGGRPVRVVAVFPLDRRVDSLYPKRSPHIVCRRSPAPAFCVDGRQTHR
jgi:hypothetical protein